MTLLKTLWLAFAAVLVGALLLGPFFAIKTAKAAPIATATSGHLTITLYSDPCSLKAVSNLPQRAVWIEAGKVSEGCWGASQFGVIMAYFEDKTVAVIPFEVFRRTEPAI